MKYVVEGFGDVGNSKYNHGDKYLPKRAFAFLDEALVWLESWARQIGDEGEVGYWKLDPEDDRVLIYEILDSGHMKVVWHFSGWHWNADEFGLPQGKFPGHTNSVYDLLMADY